jgi:hypothetical protein
LNTKTPRSREGTMAAWALLVIVICLVGWLSDGNGLIQFLVTGIIVLVVTSLLIALGLGISIAVIHALKTAENDDERTFFQILKDEYSWDAVLQDYRTILEHVRIYAREEWDTRLGPAIEPRLEKISAHARGFWNTRVKPRLKKDE